jgi:hypothetical protein
MSARYQVTSTYYPKTREELYGVKDTDTGVQLISDVWDMETAVGTAMRYQAAHRKANYPEWPTQDQDTMMSGDLGSILDEMDGHARDCARNPRYWSHGDLVSYVVRTFDGGLFAFVIAVQPLW